MTRTRWLWLVAATGVALLAISFVNGWIFHDREVRGEGYREVHVYLSAWRGVARPVTTIAALGALAIGWGRPRLRSAGGWFRRGCSSWARPWSSASSRHRPCP